MISNVGILCVKSQLYLQSSTGIDFYRSIAHEIRRLASESGVVV